MRAGGAWNAACSARGDFVLKVSYQDAVARVLLHDDSGSGKDVEIECPIELCQVLANREGHNLSLDVLGETVCLELGAGYRDPGERACLRGKGLPLSQGSDACGDAYVRFVVRWPSTTSSSSSSSSSSASEQQADLDRTTVRNLKKYSDVVRRILLDEPLSIKPARKTSDHMADTALLTDRASRL